MSDSAEKRTTFSIKARIVQALIGVSLGIVLGIVIAITAHGENRLPLPLLLACIVAAIIVHEFGHLLAALHQDFKIFSFALGPISVRREGRTLKLARSGYQVGGMISVTPRGIEDLRRRFLIVFAAGPTASFLVGLAAVGTAQVVDAKLIWMVPFGIISIVLGGVMSSIPVRFGFYWPDGARVRMLWRDCPEAERFCALMTMSALCLAGTRPRDLDAHLVDLSLSIDDESADSISSAILAYEVAMDRREFAKAEQFLEKAIERRPKCPPVVKSGIALDAAFFAAQVQRDPGAARKWFSQCQTSLIRDRYSILQVEAAMLLAESKLEDARRKAIESRAAMKHPAFPGFALASSQWLDEIVAECQAQLSEMAVKSE